MDTRIIIVWIVGMLAIVGVEHLDENTQFMIGLAGWLLVITCFLAYLVGCMVEDLMYDHEERKKRRERHSD